VACLKHKTIQLKFPIRVYYEDTDAAGVVYYANYLKFIERARTEYLRQFGLEQDELKQNHNIIFVVRKVQAEYLAPARFNQALIVETAIDNLTKIRVNFAQKILDKKTNKVLFNSFVEVVCVSSKTFKINTIPSTILETLNE
jgi:acyl-CoA thioester hydrolase